MKDKLANPSESESFMDDSNFKPFQNLSSERRNIPGFQKGLFWYCRGNSRLFYLYVKLCVNPNKTSLHSYLNQRESSWCLMMSCR